MRIIAGEYRGRKILGPVDAATTRPITDRVKTALFDRLASADRLQGAVEDLDTNEQFFPGAIAGDGPVYYVHRKN